MECKFLISQLIKLARVCSHVEDFNARNTCLIAELFKKGYRYPKLRKFFKFYRRHYELISKFCSVHRYCYNAICNNQNHVF